jgi:hypothetical protein
MKLNLDDEECQVLKQILASVEVTVLGADGTLAEISLTEFFLENLDFNEQPFIVNNPPKLEYACLSKKKWTAFKHKIKALVS